MAKPVKSKKKPAKKPGKPGRPRTKIDWTEFDKLCGLQCTLKEIAYFFDCSEDTIERAVKREFQRDFSDLWEEKSAAGRISLRREQFRLAQAGDRTMLIWLGKQYLGQKEIIGHDINPEEIELTVNHTVINAAKSKRK
jgi:hypothetical protein